MFKSRRFWIVLAVFFALLFSVPALWYFWWYPSTWRGRFDRVQMGMTEAEVKAVLGSEGEYGSYWRNQNSKLDYMEVWRLEEEEIVFEQANDPFYILAVEHSNSSWVELRAVKPDPAPAITLTKWSTPQGLIYVDFGDGQRVCGKSRGQSPCPSPRDRCKYGRSV